MSKTNYKDEIIGFYNDFLAYSNINDPEAVAWSSTEAQVKRFEVLLDIGINKDDTFLDLGCGLGHLVDYLKKHKYPIANYTGIDINSHYIFYAIQRNPEAVFKIGEIFDLNDRFDYVIGSGNFTLKMPIEEILGCISKAYEISNKGVAFNFLTEEFFGNYGDGFNSFVPEDFFETIKNIYPKCKLVTHYLGNEDFTIYIYK